jgi:hypothetical protein
MHCKISHYAICFLVRFMQSSRKQKQVTYMEDGDEADGNDARCKHIHSWPRHRI